MNKKFSLAIFIFLILIIFTSFLLKSKLKHLNFIDIENKLVYEVESFEKFENSSLYEFFNSDISDLDSLILNSKYFIKGKVVSKNIYGNGIINKIRVLNTYKGNLNETIEVYDLAYVDSYFNSRYYASTTPLVEGKEYYLFLNDSIRPNKKGAYMFSNYKYGYFSLKNDINILEEYEPSSLTLDKIKGYDFVNIKDEYNGHLVVHENYDEPTGEIVYYEKNDYTSYKMIKKEILNKY